MRRITILRRRQPLATFTNGLAGPAHPRLLSLQPSGPGPSANGRACGFGDNISHTAILNLETTRETLGPEVQPIGPCISIFLSSPQQEMVSAAAPPRAGFVVYGAVPSSTAASYVDGIGAGANHWHPPCRGVPWVQLQGQHLVTSSAMCRWASLFREEHGSTKGVGGRLIYNDSRSEWYRYQIRLGGLTASYLC